MKVFHFAPKSICSTMQQKHRISIEIVYKWEIQIKKLDTCYVPSQLFLIF